jgi:hypothetical protein
MKMEEQRKRKSSTTTRMRPGIQLSGCSCNTWKNPGFLCLWRTRLLNRHIRDICRNLFSAKETRRFGIWPCFRHGVFTIWGQRLAPSEELNTVDFILSANDWSRASFRNVACFFNQTETTENIHRLACVILNLDLSEEIHPRHECCK